MGGRITKQGYCIGRNALGEGQGLSHARAKMRHSLRIGFVSAGGKSMSNRGVTG